MKKRITIQNKKKRMKILKEIKDISNCKIIIISIIFSLYFFIYCTIYILEIKGIIGEISHDDFSNLEKYDSNILLTIQTNIEKYIEITIDEQKFLNGIIRKTKPKKIVEIGVSYGGTSVLILNAIKDIHGAKLYSIDLNKLCYRNRSVETGYIVKEFFNYLTNKWELFTGGLTSEFIEKIGNNIDFVYIDTVHFTPGEMLNWLEILPFLKEGAIVVLHDTFMMYIYDRIVKNIRNYSNNQILCYIRGELILPSFNNNTFARNIGAIKLFKNQKRYYLNYFLALGTQWEYMPSIRELDILNKFFMKYYGKRFAKIYNDAVEKNSLRFKKLIR